MLATISITSEDDWTDLVFLIVSWLCLALLAARYLSVGVYESIFSRSKKPVDPNRCATCGYDIRANSGRCSECGQPLPPRQLPRIAVYRGVVLVKSRRGE